jgi:hypothetical protein
VRLLELPPTVLRGGPARAQQRNEGVGRADALGQLLPPLRSGRDVLRVDPDAPAGGLECRGETKREVLLLPGVGEEDVLRVLARRVSRVVARRLRRRVACRPP